MTFWPGEWEQTGMDPMVGVENTISWVALLVLGSSGIPESFVIVGFCRGVPVEAYGNWSDMISCAKRKLGGIVDHAAPAMHFEVSTFATECHSTVLNMQGEYPRKIVGGAPLRLSTRKGIHKSAIQRVCSRKHSLDRKSSLHPQQPAKFWCENHWIRGPVPTYSMSSAMAVGTSGHIWSRGAQDLSGFGVSKDELQVFFKRCSYNFRPVEICTALFHTFPLYFCSADAGSPS